MWDAIYTVLLVFGGALFALLLILFAGFLMKRRREKQRSERLQRFYRDVESDMDPEQRRQVDMPNEDM